MSGGAWDYAYIPLTDLSERLVNKAFLCSDPKALLEGKTDSEVLTCIINRLLLGHHLAKVAEAMRVCEWVDSGDKSPGPDEFAACSPLAEDNYSPEDSAKVGDAAIAIFLNLFGRKRTARNEESKGARSGPVSGRQSGG